MVSCLSCSRSVRAEIEITQNDTCGMWESKRLLAIAYRRSDPIDLVVKHVFNIFTGYSVGEATAQSWKKAAGALTRGECTGRDVSSHVTMAGSKYIVTFGQVV